MDDEPDDKDDSKRRTRNQSEKMRRDQFNTLVNELSSMVAPNTRKMDKTTVLKSTISFLKDHNDNTAKSKVHDVQEAWKPEFLCNEEFTYLIMEAIEGFIMVFSTSGKIYYVSESIASLLGHHPLDVINKNIYEMINEGDRSDLYNVLQTSISKLDTMPNNRSENGITFQYYMKRGTEKIDEGVVYDLVLFEGHFRVNTEHLEKSPMGYQHDPDSRLLFVCTGRLYSPKLVRDVSLIDPNCSEFTSRHSLEWKFLFLDHRAPPIIGYLPFEVLGTSGFDYYHFDDLERITMCHQELMEKGEATSCFYRFLTKGQQWIWLQTRFYITYHQWNSKPEFVVCNHRVVSYADLVRKHKVERSDAALRDNVSRRSRPEVPSKTRQRNASPLILSDNSNAMTQKSGASNGSMPRVSILSVETSVAVLADENGVNSVSAGKGETVSSRANGMSCGTGFSHINKISGETGVSRGNGVSGEIGIFYRNSLSSQDGMNNGIASRTGASNENFLSDGTGRSINNNESRGDDFFSGNGESGGCEESKGNSEPMECGFTNETGEPRKTNVSSGNGIFEESGESSETGESNENGVPCATSESQRNVENGGNCVSSGSGECRRNSETEGNNMSFEQRTCGLHDFRGYVGNPEYRGYGSITDSSVSGVPASAWGRLGDQPRSYPNGYQAAAYMSGDASSSNPPNVQPALHYQHMQQAPKMEQPVMMPQPMGAQYMESGQYVTMDGVPMTLGRSLQMPMIMPDQAHMQLIHWPGQDLLQRKQEELQKMIMRQQEELRQVKEQLLLATLGILPPIVNVQGTYINSAGVQQNNSRVQMSIQMPLQIQQGLVYETPADASPGTNYPQLPPPQNPPPQNPPLPQ